MDETERKGMEWNGCIIPYMRIVIRLWTLRETRFCSLTSSRVKGLLGWDLSWSLDTGRDGMEFGNLMGGCRGREYVYM